MKYLILILLFAGCNASQKLRKAERLIAEAEAMGAKVKTDTVYINKEVKIKGDSTDIEIVFGRDTTIFKDRIKVVTRFKHDTIYQSILCPDSIVYFKNAVAINRTIVCPPNKNNFWKGFAIGILTLIVMVTAAKKILTKF